MTAYAFDFKRFTGCGRWAGAGVALGEASNGAQLPFPLPLVSRRLCQGDTTLSHSSRVPCGDNLTRENVMKQAASLKDFAPDTLLPGIKINTSPTDFAPIEQLKMMKFKGENWEFFGDIISAETGG